MRGVARWVILIGAVLLVVGSAFGASAADDGSVYESDMAAFVRTVDEGCPFLALKGIGGDWAEAKRELMERAKGCASDEAFLKIVIDAMRVLRDGHLRIRESKAKMPEMPPQYYPGLSFLAATEGRVTIMYAPRVLADRLGTGTVVTKIDGTDARGYLEQRGEAAWKEGGFFSSPQRARLFEYRLALRGEQGQKHTIGYLDGEEERSLTVACETAVRGWPHTYNLPSDLKRVGRSFYYAKLGDDIGYMYLRRVDTSVPQGIDEALRVHANLKGWIVDLRGNSGGGYDRNLIEQIRAFPRPVAVAIDAGCISAGETLARDFRAYAEARLFGSQSAGSSSSKRTWSFPSGIASIQFPVRSRWRRDRKPIEFNGIDPDVEVEVVPEEVRAGDNSAILRAREYIARESGRRNAEDTARRH